MIKSNHGKWILILNPHAGGGRGKRDLNEITKLLKKKNFQFDILVSAYPKHTIQLTIAVIENGFRNLIVAGGDGTLNEVANGILLQKECSPEEIMIGMIPVGTGNDWIKTFGIPNDYKKAIKQIIKGKTLLQDVGQISYTEDGEQKIRFYTNMAGFGFDALVAERANALKEKGRTGLLVYVQSLVTSYLQYQARKVNISVDGEEVEEIIFSASIGIGKYNGGGMMQAPGAIPDNGLFNLTIIKKIGFWGILRNLPGLFNGRFIKDKRVLVYQAKHISISSSKNIAGEADGENLGRSEFTIEIIPNKLKVIVGKKMIPSGSR